FTRRFRPCHARRCPYSVALAGCSLSSVARSIGSWPSSQPLPRALPSERARRLLDRLHFERDLHAVAHQHAAGLQGDVPGQPEVLAIDLVLALKPATVLPQGFAPITWNSASRATSRIFPWMVRSPITRKRSRFPSMWR